MGWTDSLVSGAIGLATGAFASRLLVDPRADLLRLQGEIAEALLLFAWVQTNVPPDASATMTEDMRFRAEQCREAERRMRALAARLVGACTALPLYRAWAFLRLAPSTKAIREVHAALIGLSNDTPPQGQDDIKNNKDRREAIRAHLGIGRFVV